MRILTCLAFAALAAAPLHADAAEPAPPQALNERVPFEGRLEVRLEPAERYNYPGRPVEIRVTYRNPTGNFISLSSDLFDPARFRALDANGQPLPSVAGAAVETRPADPLPGEIFPRREVQRDFKLSERFPDLSRLGRYTVVWEHPQVQAHSTGVQVIRTYDPDRDYLAEFRTSMGKFTVEFFPSVAPVNVKNFIDLANSDFYDSMQFHMIIPGILIQAGDSKGDGNGYPGYRVPPEFSRVRHLKGTLSMWHHHTTVDAGSQFFICLSDQSQFDGNYTVIGQVKSGMEVVDKIGQVPTTEQRSRRPFQPLQAVTIEDIRVKGR
jgi:cyclophilin family peptidyl-prolyl cis-trans isomerase